MTEFHRSASVKMPSQDMELFKSHCHMKGMTITERMRLLVYRDMGQITDEEFSNVERDIESQGEKQVREVRELSKEGFSRTSIAIKLGMRKPLVDANIDGGA